jgi:hypothetical protein
MEIPEELYAVPWGWWLVLGFLLNMFFINNDFLMMAFGLPLAYVVYLKYQEMK